MPTALFIGQSLRQRQQAAGVILAEPDGKYKVCDTCESVVVTDQKGPHICPGCHAYRFDYTRDRLIEACRKLALYPFPTLVGTIPRSIFFPEVDKGVPAPHIV